MLRFGIIDARVAREGVSWPDGELSEVLSLLRRINRASARVDLPAGTAVAPCYWDEDAR